MTAVRGYRAVVVARRRHHPLLLPINFRKALISTEDAASSSLEQDHTKKKHDFLFMIPLFTAKDPQALRELAHKLVDTAEKQEPNVYFFEWLQRQDSNNEFAVREAYKDGASLLHHFGLLQEDYMQLGGLIQEFECHTEVSAPRPELETVAPLFAQIGEPIVSLELIDAAVARRSVTAAMNDVIPSSSTIGVYRKMKTKKNWDLARQVLQEWVAASNALTLNIAKSEDEELRSNESYAGAEGLITNLESFSLLPADIIAVDTVMFTGPAEELAKVKPAVNEIFDSTAPATEVRFYEKICGFDRFAMG